MRLASSAFDSSDRERIAQAVADAEAGTSVEIVPVVATDSGRYDRAEDLVGLLTGTGVLIVAWLLFQREVPDAGGWDGLPLAIGLPTLVALLLGGFLVGVPIAMHVSWLRRIFTTRREMNDEVHHRATQLFFDRRIHHTPDASGMLVYLSLFERRAEILTDQRVLERLGQPAIDDLCRRLTEAARRGDLAEALCSTIRHAGDLLRKTGDEPGAPDPNMLRDALVTID